MVRTWRTGECSLVEAAIYSTSRRRTCGTETFNRRTREFGPGL